MKKNNNIQMPNHPFKTAQDVKRYVRDILLQVQQEETLKKIIDITSKIDYAVIYHLDDDEALARLYELREKKKTGGLSEEEWKELWSLEPDDEIKYIILIEELLGNADVFNLGLGIEPDTLLPYIYTGCHWKNVSRPLLKEFLAVAANKADFNYYDFWKNVTARCWSKAKTGSFKLAPNFTLHPTYFNHLKRILPQKLQPTIFLGIPADTDYFIFTQ